MKKNFLLASICLCYQLVKAQDTIVKFNGEQILSKIIEVTPTEIKFKKFIFLDGPVYVEEKSSVQFIRYANGMKEEFSREYQKKSVIENPAYNTDYYTGRERPINNKVEVWGSRYRYKDRNINERELHAMFLKTKNKELITLVGKAKDNKALQYIGFGAIPFGIAALYFIQRSYTNAYGVYTALPSSDDLAAAGICFIVAIACPISSGIFKHNRTLYNRQAVKVYNETY